ncbi:TPA: hypothetical protein QDB51_003458 [Burkholderia vietnamiensis]|nr:hypothetical protein [Burkholderia vietnamiensis]
MRGDGMETIITSYVFPILSAVWLALLVDWMIENFVLNFEKEKPKSELMLAREAQREKEVVS